MIKKFVVSVFSVLLLGALLVGSGFSSSAHAATTPKTYVLQAARANAVVAGTIVSAANGLSLSAELGYTGNKYAMLRARAHPGAIGAWEQFNAIGSGRCGSTFSLQSQANGLFVSAELGYTGNNYAMLRARASTIGPWEQFL